MAVTANCAECGRRAQVNLTPDGPSLCLACAGLDDMADSAVRTADSAVRTAMCPGCGNPVSEQERLTGVCGKDGDPIDQERSTVVIDVDRLVDMGYMQDFGAGYPEWS